MICAEFDVDQWNRYCADGHEDGAEAAMIAVEADFFACENAAARTARNHGFSQEDIWHEMRAIGGDERQAIRSLIEAEARLDN